MGFLLRDCDSLRRDRAAGSTKLRTSRHSGTWCCHRQPHLVGIKISVDKPDGLLKLTLMKSPTNQSSISSRFSPWNMENFTLLSEILPGTDCCRSCSSNFRLRLRPVPSYLAKKCFHIKSPPGLLPVDGGGHEDQVGSQESLDQGQRDRCRFVDHHQLGLGKFGSIPCFGCDSAEQIFKKTHLDGYIG